MDDYYSKEGVITTCFLTELSRYLHSQNKRSTLAPVPFPHLFGSSYHVFTHALWWAWKYMEEKRLRKNSFNNKVAY